MRLFGGGASGVVTMLTLGMNWAFLGVAMHQTFFCAVILFKIVSPA